jgi:hypothetical protein
MTQPPLPDDFICFDQHLELLYYDETISQPFKERGIKRPEDIQNLSPLEQARLTTATHRLDADIFKELYQDNNMHKWSRGVIAALTTDRIENPERKKWQGLHSATMRDATILGRDADALTLFMWRDGRTSRWERLLAKLGLAPFAPKGFRLYRGVQDPYAKTYIPAVLAAWQEEKALFVKQDSLASWSFKQDIAMLFANDFHKCDSGVVFGGHIPFQQTHADKLTDGGNFLPWWNQYEALVGANSQSSPIEAHPLLTTVLYKDKWYTHQNKNELAQALQDNL